MEQETGYIWTDIRKFEDILVRDPKSYCFAQLAELYRKAGQVDDAIATARRGLDIHPDYTGGLMALGRAYFDKGLKTESRVVLEKVIRDTPENIVAWKLLSQIYLETGERDVAGRALRTVLELNPDDEESRRILRELKSLGRQAADVVAEDTEPEDTVAEAVAVDDEELLEEAELVSDEELPLEGEPSVELSMPEELPGDDTGASGGEEPADAGRDPLTTATLAEIYLAQGFHDQALNIYRKLFAADPLNREYARRITEIEESLAAVVPVPGGAIEIAVGRSDIPGEALADAGGATASDARAVELLEEWLERIRRRRACH